VSNAGSWSAQSSQPSADSGAGSSSAVAAFLHGDPTSLVGASACGNGDRSSLGTVYVFIDPPGARSLQASGRRSNLDSPPTR
jgi:hypothetical protein